jgi:hypothetical protein
VTPVPLSLGGHSRGIPALSQVSLVTLSKGFSPGHLGSFPKCIVLQAFCTASSVPASRCSSMVSLSLWEEAHLIGSSLTWHEQNPTLIASMRSDECKQLPLGAGTEAP